MTGRDITLIVKTVERPGCLRRLLKSVRKHAPDVSVLVADDGPVVAESTSLARVHGATFVPVPFGCGAPESYNRMIEEATTEFIAIADDDCVFGSQTNLEALARWCEVLGTDVAGGAVWNPKGFTQNFVGDLCWSGPPNARRLRLIRAFPVETCEYGKHRNRAPRRADVVLNFFVAPRASMLKAPWDAELKLFRHLDWFITAREAGLVVSYCPSVTVIHDHVNEAGYRGRRTREMGRYRALFLQKHGLVRVDEQ